MAAPRILIVKTSSMGDVVHALPLASDLRAAYPGVVIDWVVEEGFAAIPALHPAVARVIPVALRRWRRALLAAATWREIGQARAALAATPYQAVLDCQGLVKSAWIGRGARGPHFGPDRASAREPLAALFYDHPLAIPRDQHAIERNRLLGALALGYMPGAALRFGLNVAPDDGAGSNGNIAQDGAPLASPYAVLLTNASRPTKLWPPAYWRQVEAELARLGFASLLPWGSAAEEAATRERAQPMQRARLAARLPLDRMAAVLAGARVVVGLDTGLTHLAAAVGAPTVGIFCDYDPALVGVRGDAPCESLGGATGGPAVPEVLAALARVLDGANSR